MVKRGDILIFKLFNSIKSPHEADDFARLEIQGLCGVKPTKVQNFYDIIRKRPMNIFTKKDVRFQDILTHELPYGKTQGYLITIMTPINIERLINRLGYTREIFLITKSTDPEKSLKEIFPKGIVGKNVQYFVKEGYTLFRFITDLYYLENSEYIKKISRNEEEIERNVVTLMEYLISNTYRVPASSTMRIGRRLEDYFAIREELSLYLTHYMHPYKGKFHPKMVRALLNYICPEEEGKVVIDNFAGSGTLLLEATLMGIDSKGVEINPLSVLMTNVKSSSLKIRPLDLKNEINKFLMNYEVELNKLKHTLKGQKMLIEELDISNIKEQINKIPKDIVSQLAGKNSKSNIYEILLAKELITQIKKPEIQDFMMLGLSGCISDAFRRKKVDFIDIMKERLNDLYQYLYIFHSLNKYLKISLGRAEAYVGDTRDIDSLENGHKIENNSIDGIVNSPPYSTALDYIKNDEPQLEILGLVNSLEKLEENMMGNPRKNYDSKELRMEIENKNPDFERLPEQGKDALKQLIDGNRWDAALRCYKFFKDMDKTAQEMYRVLKQGAKCVIIIGNNHFKVDRKYISINNSRVIFEQCKKAGFKKDQIITRELEKTSVGNIRKESVLILTK